MDQRMCFEPCIAVVGVGAEEQARPHMQRQTPMQAYRSMLMAWSLCMGLASQARVHLRAIDHAVLPEFCPAVLPSILQVYMRIARWKSLVKLLPRSHCAKPRSISIFTPSYFPGMKAVACSEGRTVVKLHLEPSSSHPAGSMLRVGIGD